MRMDKGTIMMLILAGILIMASLFDIGNLVIKREVVKVVPVEHLATDNVDLAGLFDDSRD